MLHMETLASVAAVFLERCPSDYTETFWQAAFLLTATTIPTVIIALVIEGFGRSCFSTFIGFRDWFSDHRDNAVGMEPAERKNTAEQ